MANNNDLAERFVSPITDHYYAAKLNSALPILHHHPDLSPKDRDNLQLHPAVTSVLNDVAVFSDHIEFTNTSFTAGRGPLSPAYSPTDLPKHPSRAWSELNTKSLHVVNLQSSANSYAHVHDVVHRASDGVFTALSLLVSYATPVAMLVRNNGCSINGQQAAVFELWHTPIRHSATTDRHISHALSAYTRACRVLDIPRFVYTTKAIYYVRHTLYSTADPTLVLRTHESHYQHPRYLLKLTAERIAAQRLHARTRWDALLNARHALDDIRRKTQELIPAALINEHFAREIADTKATIDAWCDLTPTPPPEEQVPGYYFIHDQTAMRDPKHPSLLQLRAMAEGLLALERNPSND